MAREQETDANVSMDPDARFASGTGEAPPPSPDQADSLSQVRAILLGPVSRDLQHRVDNLGKRLDDVERRLRDDLNDRAGKLDQKLEELTRRLDEVNERIEAVSAELAREAARLRDETVDRATLSSLFSEVALRVGGGMHGTPAESGEEDIDLDALIDSRTGGTT